jgi:3-deoxy-D-manno-octulosonate 8-phosphate phosphatase (KDO 8-P phosphatase)
MSFSHFADLPADIRARAARIRLACFDVDGVLTDGKLWYGEDGREAKAFNVHDGLGIKLLREHGIEVALITARRSPIVAARAGELGIAQVHQAVLDKREWMLAIAHELKLQAEAVAYTGDDLQDLAAMQAAGLSIAVANAHPWVRERARWRTRAAGGDGAAREVADLLLGAQGHAEAILERFLKS